MIEIVKISIGIVFVVGVVLGWVIWHLMARRERKEYFAKVRVANVCVAMPYIIGEVRRLVTTSEWDKLSEIERIQELNYLGQKVGEDLGNEVSLNNIV